MLPLIAVISSCLAQVPHVNLSPNGSFSFDAVGQAFIVRTMVSAPGGRWVDSGWRPRGGAGASATWDTPEVRITRTVASIGDHLDVKDEIRNKTNRLVGVIINDDVKALNAPNSVRLAGNEVTGDRGRYCPSNPSVFGSWSTGGLGIVAQDDIFRAQGKLGVSAADGMKLVDDSLGVSPGEPVLLEWSIYPTPSGDYWDFVNQVRKDWNCNYTLTGPCSYRPDFADTEENSPRQASDYSNWAKQRGLKYVISTFAKNDDDTLAHGTAITAPGAAKSLGGIKSWMTKMKSGDSDVKPLIYFHPQISTEPDAEQKYSDSVAHDRTGAVMVYPAGARKERFPLFIPTMEDRYGKALMSTLNTILASTDISGIYWDEMSIAYPELGVSGSVFGSFWDGHSVAISPSTHEVLDRKSIVSLAIQPFEIAAVNDIREKGRALLANTQPYTRTMMDLHIERFVEGQDIDRYLQTGTGNCSVFDGNLGCPLVLANFKPEKTAADAIQHAVKVFGLGGIYFGWVERWTPNNPDFNQLLWPITPVDIRPGVITGEERIIVTKSGTYGFSDGSKAQAYVFDDQANLQSDPKVTTSGGNMVRIDLPPGGLGILVKR